MGPMQISDLNVSMNESEGPVWCAILIRSCILHCLSSHCGLRCSRAMTGLARKRRRVQSRVHYYSTDDQPTEEQTSLSQQRHRHTSFVARTAGISAQTLYVTARDVLTSPPIAPEDSGSTVDGFERRAEEDVDLLYEEAFETLQPESFTDFNDYLNEKKKRKRTAGVSESYPRTIV